MEAPQQNTPAFQRIRKSWELKEKKVKINKNQAILVKGAKLFLAL